MGDLYNMCPVCKRKIRPFSIIQTVGEKAYHSSCYDEKKIEEPYKLFLEELNSLISAGECIDPPHILWDALVLKKLRQVKHNVTRLGGH